MTADPFDESWKSPEIRAAESALSTAIDRADEIVAEAVKVGVRGTEPEPERRADDPGDGETTVLEDAW